MASFAFRAARALAPAAACSCAASLCEQRQLFRDCPTPGVARCRKQRGPVAGRPSDVCVRCDDLVRQSSQKLKAAIRRPPTLDEFTSFDTYIFDCDGVLWGISADDSRTAVATVNYLLALGKRAMFVTNNSNRSRRDFVKELERKGVAFGERSDAEKIGMVISASYTTATYLRDNGLRRPYVITSDIGVLEELRLIGITEYFATVCDDGTVAPEFACSRMGEVGNIINAHPFVDCIVVGWDHSLTAAKVATAVNYIKWHEDLYGSKLGFRPMPIIACSGDSGGVLGTVEFEGRRLKLRAIGNGAMADIVARSFDPPKEWVDMGKPSDALLWLLRDPGAYGVDVSRALMVGDTLQTDIVFGNRGGMRTLLVLSGVTTSSDIDNAIMSGNPMRRPTYVMPNLGAFVEQGTLPQTL